MAEAERRSQSAGQRKVGAHIGDVSLTSAPRLPLPPDLQELYEEARRLLKANDYEGLVEFLGRRRPERAQIAVATAWNSTTENAAERMGYSPIPSIPQKKKPGKKKGKRWSQLRRWISG